MPRRPSPDLMKDWKIPLPARIAGAVEFELMNSRTGKPRYGERSRLVTQLLATWLEERSGRKYELSEPLAPDLMPKARS